MKIINEQLLDETQAKALQSPRLRMNYNFHERLDDPINRLLNAMEPGTYLRPHRHLNPAKDEIFLLLRGKVAVFLFDEEGNITEKTILNPRKVLMERRSRPEHGTGFWYWNPDRLFMR